RARLVPDRREFGPHAPRLPSQAEIDIRPRLGAEPRLPDFEALLSEVRTVREQLEQSRRAPRATEIAREGERRDGGGPVHDAHGAGKRGVIPPLGPEGARG